MTDDFLDVYLPDAIRGFPFYSSPRTSTTITAVANGSERRNKNWLYPLRILKAPEAVKCHDDVEDLHDHWTICDGPLASFPLRDPFDFATVRLSKVNLVPTTTAGDQVFGIGDGVTRTFQLTKDYTRGGVTKTQPIYLPVLETIQLAANALPLTTVDPALPGGPYTADVVRYGGSVTLDHAPEVGVILTWGGLFDRIVRFEADDSFDRIVQAFQVDGFSDLTFVEIRPCLSASTSDGSG